MLALHEKNTHDMGGSAAEQEVESSGGDLTIYLICFQIGQKWWVTTTNSRQQEDAGGRPWVLY
jgi:hypothetical protein